MRRACSRWGGVILAFSAGIMLAAAMVGLIIPALECEGGNPYICSFGILVGGACINLIDLFLPRLCRILGRRAGRERERIYLFLLAIGIHNLPEGIAAGVGFGTGDVTSGLLIALGIALQNIPEGAVVILPMLSVGISPKISFMIASLTGAVEVIGTLLGYLAVSFSGKILPFALSFAGGTMIQVVNREMIPDTHTGDGALTSSMATMLGFCLMLIINELL